MNMVSSERRLLAILLLGLSVLGVVGQTNVTTVERPVAVETNGDAAQTNVTVETNGDAVDDLSEAVVDELEDLGEELGLNMTVNGTGGNLTAPTMAPTIPTNPPSTSEGCYTNLDAIFTLIEDDDKLFPQKRYVICPGSVMDIGFLVPGVGIDQGQAPIVPRSNTQFLCGEDGKSENNCILKGGDFGVIAVPVFFRQDLSVNNVEISGFTFEGQVQYAVFVATAGDINFIDCIFRNSANFGPIVMNYDSTLDLGRRLYDEEECDSPWDRTHDYIHKYRDGKLPRRLKQEAEVEVEDTALIPDRTLQNNDLFVSLLQDCKFENLQQIERKLGVEFGVFSIKGPDHDINITDCTWSNNQYGNQELTPIGYAILVQEAMVTMNGLCFVENDFRGSGVVLLEQTADPFTEKYLEGNYATTDDADLDCAFAAWIATDEDRRNNNFTCVPVQTDECGGEPVDPSTAEAPAAAPDSGCEGSASLSRLALVGSSLLFMVLSLFDLDVMLVCSS